MQGQPTAIVRQCNRCDICANQRDTNAFAKLFFSANHDQSTMPFSHCIDDNIIQCAKKEGKVSPQLSPDSYMLNFSIYETRKSDGEWMGSLCPQGKVDISAIFCDLEKLTYRPPLSTQALDQSYENTKVKSIVLAITFLQINNLDPAVTRVGHSVSVYWDSGC